jgi:hypothetical protein
MTKIAGDRGLMDGKDAIDLLEKQIAARDAAGVEMSINRQFYLCWEIPQWRGRRNLII